jgi:MoaA/NifB/PqqE/SkfB family radical SAM enzyme
MAIDLFRELIPFLKHTDLIYLQGWGEPLLHHYLFEMIRICKERGKRVGLTTNGTLMDEGTLQKLVDLEVDVIGVSLAGTRSETHNHFRKGTDFQKVVSGIERLHGIKVQRETQRPEVHLAYLMLKANFCELPEIISLARRTGAKQVVASNLTLIMDPGLFQEAIFNDKDRMDYYCAVLEQIKDRAAREHIIFDYHGPGLDEASVSCRENVRHACVMSVRGDVVPCVFTNPVLCDNQAVGNSSWHIFKDQFVPLTGMPFGNIRSETLTRIWNSKAYHTFRDVFDPKIPRRPEKTLLKMPQSCLRCYKRLGV